MLPARQVVRQGAAGAAERVVLSYDERFLRRKRLICESGASVMVDLAETVSLEDGDALVTDSGQRVAVVAAQEPVMQVRGANLARLAWHIGNRHAPCQIAEGYLVIRRDHVLEAMLLGLGADLAPVIAPFRPEGGAYGHGRTMGHDHAH
ncbi:MAG: urease accessory protein UreE [Rhodobacteraceae bacterium]|nr:urease accessory protein UreE [Paracoccaceae bacterium]